MKQLSTIHIPGGSFTRPLKNNKHYNLGHLKRNKQTSKHGTSFHILLVTHRTAVRSLTLQWDPTKLRRRVKQTKEQINIKQLFPHVLRYARRLGLEKGRQKKLSLPRRRSGWFLQ